MWSFLGNLPFSRINLTDFKIKICTEQALADSSSVFVYSMLHQCCIITCTKLRRLLQVSVCPLSCLTCHCSRSFQPPITEQLQQSGWTGLKWSWCLILFPMHQLLRPCRDFVVNSEAAFVHVLQDFLVENVQVEFISVAYITFVLKLTAA